MSRSFKTEREITAEANRIMNFLASMPSGITSAERPVVRWIMLQTSGEMLAQGEIFDIVAKNLGAGVYQLWLSHRELVSESPRKPAAVMPSSRPRVLVEVFSQPGEHDPFICGAEGHITVEMIEEIERDLREGYEDLCDSGAGSYLFEVRHQEGHYGDEGRCEIPPHFELTLVAFERPRGSDDTGAAE